MAQSSTLHYHNWIIEEKITEIKLLPIFKKINQKTYKNTIFHPKIKHLEIRKPLNNKAVPYSIIILTYMKHEQK